MSRRSILMAFVFLIPGCAGFPQRAPDPVLARTFRLEGVGAPRPDVGVPGRIDHLAYDPRTQRLFVAALENGSVEVIDLEAGQRIRSICGLGQPQGAAIAQSVGCAVVACGDGVVHVYDTRTLEEKKAITLGRGADNVRYDAKADVIYVTYGGAEGGAIAALHPGDWSKLRETRFRSRPESFQLDPVGPRFFANLPGGIRATADGAVAIADRNTGQVKQEIALAGRARNFPMAYDPAGERLFVASRRPAKLIVLDPHAGAVIGEADCGEDSDDLFYDAATKHVLVICGGFRPDMQVPPASGPAAGDAKRDEKGSIDVFAVDERGGLRKERSTPTARHARTGLLVPQRRAIYLAVPLLDGRDPEIREYKLD